jgi:signal transduction histidine kinase
MPITTDDRELEKASKLLAEASKLKASLKTGRLTKRVRASRTRKIHELFDQAQQIMDRVQLVYDAYDAQQKALKSGLVN